jgi:hypothetical protein
MLAENNMEKRGRNVNIQKICFIKNKATAFSGKWKEASVCPRRYIVGRYSAP